MTKPNQQNSVNNHNYNSLEEDVFVFPLSFAQESLWLLEQITTAKTNYNSVGCVHLVGCFNISNLQQALTEIVERHEILRTNFTIIDEHPAQIIYSPINVSLSLVDLQNLSETEQLNEIQSLALSEQNHRFNLAKDFLLRLNLVKLGEKSHVLIIGTHHIICDRWSLDILMKEVSLLYRKYNKETVETLPELKIQYADYSEWQREYLQGDTLKNKLNYWQDKLKDCPPFIELPTDYPRPSVKTFDGCEYRLIISSQLLNHLRTFSQSHKVTLFMTLLTGLKILLYKWTGQKDLVVGTVVAGRTRTEIESLIGCFMNFLAIRDEINPEQTVESFLQEVKTTVLDAYSHQDCPFEKVVESLKLERQLSYNPLYNVALLLQEFTFQTDFSNEIQSYLLDFEGETSVLDIRVEAYETSKGLEIKFEYSTDLFELATIQRMASNFQVLLEEIVANPQQKICELQILTQQEQEQLLVAFNNTQTQYPLHKCIHQLFAEQVEKTPNHLAVFFEDQQLTYRELNENANQLAHYLRELGVKAETLVGICLERSIEMVIGLLGILKAGGAYVPIDPTYPTDRLNYMLTDSQVPVLLTQEKLKQQLSEFEGKIICLDTAWAEIDHYSKTNPENLVTSDNLIYVIYTSGSTGKPKGVMNIHRALVNRLLWMQEMYQLNSHDRVLQKTPFSFDVSVWEFFWTLTTGATLVVAKPEGHQDPDYLVDLIQKEKITTIHFVPSMLQMFVEAKNVEKCQNNLKRVICSGEALPYDLQERFFAKLGKCELHNLYGPTEAAIDVSYWQCQKETSLQKVPIGKPIANTQLYILDAHLQPVPIGVVGELHIGGEGLARGYLNRLELTQEKFIANPFSQVEGSRLYKTGDLCRYLPDGNIEYIGRIDYQVKIRGFRIELGEIESVLVQHNRVRESVVVDREDQLGNKKLVAYVISQPRIPYITECQIEYKGESISVNSVDFSIQGIGLDQVKETFTKDTPVRLYLPLPGEEEKTYLNGTIAWRQEQRMGIEFHLNPEQKKVVKKSFDSIQVTAKKALEMWQKIGNDHQIRVICKHLVEWEDRKLTSINLSGNGICLNRVPPSWQKEMLIYIGLQLPGEEKKRTLKGTIAWSEKGRAGVELHLNSEEKEALTKSINSIQLSAQEFSQMWERHLIGQLRNHLAQKLPYYMIPSAFGILDSLPLTANGKINRCALPPVEKYSQTQMQFVAPRTHSEEVLATIWREVLGVEQLGVNDNFFELGGNSLLATQISSRIRESFCVEFALQNVFVSPTVAELAKLLDLQQLEEADANILAEALEEIDLLSEEDIELFVKE